jgi:hypothetical protein
MGGNSWPVVLKDVGCEEDEEADDDSAILGQTERPCTDNYHIGIRCASNEFKGLLK